MLSSVRRERWRALSAVSSVARAVWEGREGADMALLVGSRCSGRRVNVSSIAGERGCGGGGGIRSVDV